MDENTSENQNESNGPSKVMMFGGITVLVLVVIVGFVLVSSAKNRTDVGMASEETAEVSDGEVAGESMSEVREIVVDSKEFSYAPSALTLKKGEKVKIVLENTGKMTHDLVIEELDLATSITKPGDTDTIEFTVPEDTDVLTFYCSVGNHRAQGMEGKITIE